MNLTEMWESHWSVKDHPPTLKVAIGALKCSGRDIVQTAELWLCSDSLLFPTIKLYMS